MPNPDNQNLFAYYTVPQYGGMVALTPTPNQPLRKYCPSGCRGGGEWRTFNYAFWHCGGKYPVGVCSPHPTITDHDQLQFDLAFEFKALEGFDLADFGLPATHTEKGINYDPFGANDNDGIFTRAAMTEDGKGCGTSATAPTVKACIRIKPSPVPGEPPRFWMNQVMARVKYEQFSTVYDLGYFHTVSGVCCPLPDRLKNKAAEFRNLFFEEELALCEPIQCNPFSVKLNGYLFISQAAYMGYGNVPAKWGNQRVAEFTLTISNPEKVADYTNFNLALQWKGSWSSVPHWDYVTAAADTHPWVPNGRCSGGLFNPPDTPPNKSGDSMVGLCPTLLNNSEPVSYQVNLEWEDKLVESLIKPEIAGGLSFVCTGKTNWIQHTNALGDVQTRCEENFSPLTTRDSSVFDQYTSARYNNRKTATVCDPPHDPFNDPLVIFTELNFEQDLRANPRTQAIIFGKMTNQQAWGWDIQYIWADNWRSTGIGNGADANVKMAVECDPFKMTITGMPVMYTRYQQNNILVGHFKATITLVPGWTKPGECHAQKYGAQWWKVGGNCIQSISEPYNYGYPVGGPYATFNDCLAGIVDTSEWPDEVLLAQRGEILSAGNGTYISTGGPGGIIITPPELVSPKTEQLVMINPGSATGGGTQPPGGAITRRVALNQVTVPCANLGKNIEDPATCGCGTSVLAECSVFGQCRRTGTPKAGEGICISCAEYKAP